MPDPNEPLKWSAAKVAPYRIEDPPGHVHQVREDIKAGTDYVCTLLTIQKLSDDEMKQIDDALDKIKTLLENNTYTSETEIDALLGPVSTKINEVFARVDNITKDRPGLDLMKQSAKTAKSIIDSSMRNLFTETKKLYQDHRSKHRP